MTQAREGAAGATSAGTAARFIRSRYWLGSLTARMLLLVLLAVAPALAIQTYNEFALRQSREAEIRNKTIQITRQFGAEIGELKEGAHQFLVALSRLPAVQQMDPAACSRVLPTRKATSPASAARYR